MWKIKGHIALSVPTVTGAQDACIDTWESSSHEEDKYYIILIRGLTY